VRSWFAPDAPLHVGRAPGRLDVMGGIADYSGALVLELPLARAAFVAVQRRAGARCEVVTRRDGRWHAFAIDSASLVTGALREPRALAGWFREHGGDDRWAAYVVGVVQWCLHRTGGRGGGAPGLRLLVDSQVPEGKGVSSSAAIEVATMAAVAASLGVAVTAPEMAAACQWVENHVVGAPCGIMDQMTSACGRRDRLLRLRCQPGTVEGHVEVPAGYRFYGIDSGVRHAVTGADYGTVRTAAFMGYRIVADAAGLPAARDGARVRVDDPVWRGHLANVPLAEFESRFEPLLPEAMAGAEFLARYGGITDDVTAVAPDRRYPVRAATAHPVREQARVERFAALLAEVPARPDAAAALGALMYASHASYGACGLGSEATDRLVALVADVGPAGGLFGAKITGGGSGGTVAVLGTAGAERAVRAVAARYAAETGRAAAVFAESGPGADETGVLVAEAGAGPVA
jgi:L-arabinokinase